METRENEAGKALGANRKTYYLLGTGALLRFLLGGGAFNFVVIEHTMENSDVGGRSLEASFDGSVDEVAEMVQNLLGVVELFLKNQVAINVEGRLGKEHNSKR